MYLFGFFQNSDHINIMIVQKLMYSEDAKKQSDPCYVYRVKSKHV